MYFLDQIIMVISLALLYNFINNIMYNQNFNLRITPLSTHDGHQIVSHDPVYTLLEKTYLELGRGGV